MLALHYDQCTCIIMCVCAESSFSSPLVCKENRYEWNEARGSNDCPKHTGACATRRWGTCEVEMHNAHTQHHLSVMYTYSEHQCICACTSYMYNDAKVTIFLSIKQFCFIKFTLKTTTAWCKRFDWRKLSHKPTRTTCSTCKIHILLLWILLLHAVNRSKTICVEKTLGGEHSI